MFDINNIHNLTERRIYGTKENNETVDKMLNDIDQLFKEYWLNAKKYYEPYTELLSKLQPYKKLTENKI